MTQKYLLSLIFENKGRDIKLNSRQTIVTIPESNINNFEIELTKNKYILDHVQFLGNCAIFEIEDLK